ncbi:hypothetical protein BC941DRAFT_127241 [Chlamydoabsidia padenii]|nr:hypothetical protein BC941DRAFT_127241 [Chlamydoabsidia padenii]
MDSNRPSSHFDPSRAWTQQTESGSSSYSTEGDPQYTISQYPHHYQQTQQQQLQQPTQQQQQLQQKATPSSEASTQPAKRSRISRACDTCRKKKIRQVKTECSLPWLNYLFFYSSSIGAT